MSWIAFSGNNVSYVYGVIPTEYANGAISNPNI